MPLPSPNIVIRQRFVCLDGFVIPHLSHLTITHCHTQYLQHSPRLADVGKPTI